MVMTTKTTKEKKMKIKPYQVPTINNKKDYLEFKEEIENHDSFLAIDDMNMALELHLGKAILNFFKTKYE